MKNLEDSLVICSVEHCLGPQGELLESDLAAAELFNQMGGRLVLETSGSPFGVRELHRRLGLDTPVLCWEGNWLYTFASGKICSEPALPEEEIKALVRDLLEAFPAAAVAVLSAEGTICLPRINRLAHAQLKSEKSLYILEELDAIPAPWYQVALYAEPAQLGRLRQYLDEKEFKGYRCVQKDLRLQLLPQGLGKEKAVVQLCGQQKVLPENALWLGCKELPSSVLAKLEPPIAAWDASEEVRIFAQSRLPRQHDGCIGECLYRLCKEQK